MSKNQNTPCGCRCVNGANLSISASPAATLYGHPVEGLDSAQIASLIRTRGRILPLYSERRPLGEVEVNFTGRGLKFPEDATLSCCLVQCLEEFNAEVIKLLSDCFVGHAAVVDGYCHCSSPVVAESEADTSDAPAMTVQEGGSSDAAPGVEGVSPASSTPRFVAVGACAYDRKLNRLAQFEGHATAQEVVFHLNNGDDTVSAYGWEDAK